MKVVDKAKYDQATASMEIFYMLMTSLVYILPMLADLLTGLFNKNLRFPCKFASFYPAIAVPMTMTFISSLTNLDRPITKLGSVPTMAFISTMVANMLPSLGSMDSDTLLEVVTGYPLLAVVVIAFSCSDLKFGLIGDVNIACIQLAMLVFLNIILISAAITIPSFKKMLDYKYDITGHRNSKDQHPQDAAALEKLRHDEERYKILVENGNPEFIMASGIISLTVLITYIFFVVEVVRMNGSGYRWCSMITTESIGVVVGSIAPICRCFMAANFESSSWWNRKHLFRIEDYWTQKLYEWKLNNIISSSRPRKLVRKLKNHNFRILIRFQIGIVETCRIIGLIPVVVVICITYCSYYLKSWKPGRKCGLLQPQGSKY